MLDNGRCTACKAGAATLLAAMTLVDIGAAEEAVPVGFFGHLGVGAGFTRYYEKGKAPNQSETKIRSRSLSGNLDLLLGGAVVPGLVVGAGISGRTMVDPSFQVRGALLESTSATLGLGALGLFGQWYPGWVAPRYGQLYLRAQAGFAESAVQFQHPALSLKRQYGPLVGGAVGYTFAETRGFHLSAEAMGVGSWLSARSSRARVETSWYSGSYGLAVTYY